MRRGNVCATLVLTLCSAGCHRETVVERAARQYRERQESRIAAARLETIRFAGMTDPQMVRANQTEGLGLALRPAKTELRAGETLKLHLVYENLAASVPVSATTCQGFSISVEDEAVVETRAMDLMFSCAQDDPLRDNGVTLPRGQLRSVEVAPAASLQLDHAGQFIVRAEWRSFRLTDGRMVHGSEYSVLQSNAVLITVR